MTATTLTQCGWCDDERIISAIAAALEDIQFGAVEINLHNGQVVQIDGKRKNPLSALDQGVLIDATPRDSAREPFCVYAQPH